MRSQKRRLVGLRERLHAGLLGREVQAGWIHGDFWLGNIRVAPDTGRATGIIDWDCAGSPELPAHDLVHLALYGQSLERGVSLGSMVAEVVEKGTWPAECEELIRHSRWSWGDRISDSDVALLYWLRYVSAMIDQQRDYVHHSVLVWQYRNVLRVLRAL
jgi:aminoglycoside phosphotransferase (APT) family kinase protein